MKTQKQLNELTYEIIGCAIEVHKTMGPGLLENIYHYCLIEELKTKKITYESELKIPVFYKNRKLEVDLRCDILIENSIIVELKSVSEINPIHEAQLLTYMKLLKAPKGILINFNCFNIFKEGQKTFVNEYFKNLD
ncbi:MAG: GxxExxY protein [Flavobacterium sp.]|jgi:GxxExxY protein